MHKESQGPEGGSELIGNILAHKSVMHIITYRHILGESLSVNSFQNAPAR